MLVFKVFDLVQVESGDNALTLVLTLLKKKANDRREPHIILQITCTVEKPSSQCMFDENWRQIAAVIVTSN